MLGPLPPDVPIQERRDSEDRDARGASFIPEVQHRQAPRRLWATPQFTVGILRFGNRDLFGDSQQELRGKSQMSEYDRAYYQRRAEIETELAQRATLARVVQVHYQLAEAYLDKLASIEPVQA